MRKPVQRSRRPRTASSGGTLAPAAKADGRGLLDRILDAPHLAHVVPRLPPEMLHRVIEYCGLEACGELVALATPGQLARVFDLDLWKAARPGHDEQLDADRFGLWLEVMMESGAAVAAHTVAGIDVNLAMAAFAQHMLVFDPAVAPPSESADGDEMPVVDPPHDGPASSVGGYLVVGKRTDSWDAVVAVLRALDSRHHDYFHRLMRGCRIQSNSGRELDGLDDLLSDREQVLFDAGVTRERRREQQGYMTPAQARAFLQMARRSSPGRDTTPAANPIARAYFQALEWTEEPDDASLRLTTGSGERPLAEDSAAAMATFVEILRDAGVLPEPPRARLDGPQGAAPRLARIDALMQFAADRDPVAFARRGQELAFLANTIAAGCSLQARPFTAEEASSAAVATCNLGLENWDAGAATLPGDFLIGHDLVSAFERGWAVLHQQVCLYAAEQLIAVLKALRGGDRETRAGLNALRMALTKHWRAGAPWRARDALDVMAILDLPAWAALLGLIDECPVMHAGIGVAPGSRARQISATAFTFISENSEIAVIHAFMRSLPETLRG
ncbi:MAG: hypothetical protein JWL71_3136 [Acidobacteria bacterium]|nr:hypothetical protein [Acidobacteriota bacterium]